MKTTTIECCWFALILLSIQTSDMRKRSADAAQRQRCKRNAHCSRKTVISSCWLQFDILHRRILCVTCCVRNSATQRAKTMIFCCCFLLLEAFRWCWALFLHWSGSSRMCDAVIYVNEGRCQTMVFVCRLTGTINKNEIARRGQMRSSRVRLHCKRGPRKKWITKNKEYNITRWQHDRNKFLTLSVTKGRQMKTNKNTYLRSACTRHSLKLAHTIWIYLLWKNKQ